MDEGELTTDPNVVLNECACVFQYAQTVFEGMKAIQQKTDISLLSVLTSTQSVLQTPQGDWKCQYSRRIVL